MSERDARDPTAREAEPVRFAIPEPLLEKLCERRDRMGRARPERRPARAGRTYLTTVGVVRSASTREDVPALAAAFVQDMNDLQTAVEEELDAFLLDPGMGPMTYLTRDGRIILDHRTWDGEGIVVETSLDSAVAALVVGAKKTGLDELLALIPPLASGSACPRCSGARWVTLAPQLDFRMVCPVCSGRGEVDELLLHRARERGVPTSDGGAR